MIALCLGGAPSVWSDLKAAKALLAGRPHIVIACNYAGIHYPGQLDGWATLHPELFSPWSRERSSRGLNTDYRLFAYVGHFNCPGAEIVPERFKGSSGLYMAQVALEAMGAAGAILCGVPIEQDAGHFHEPGPWSDAERYRSGFRAAAAEIGPSLRSMSGWTAELLGKPDSAWLTERATAHT